MQIQRIFAFGKRERFAHQTTEALIRALYFLKLAEAGQPIPGRTVEEMATIVA